MAEPRFHRGLERAGAVVKLDKMKFNRINQFSLKSKKFQLHDLRVGGGGVWLSSNLYEKD